MKISLELVPNSIIPTSGEALDEVVLDEHPTLIRNSTAQSAEKANCLWCSRAFRRRTTGGSAQRFCSTEHRKAFWTAARRWTMRAIETGLLSVDCLKAVQTSVHAARGASGREPEVAI
jgi:hypothetical protein